MGRFVVVRLGDCAVVGQAHLLGGVGGRDVGAHAIAVNAVESASFTLEQRALAGRGKFRRRRFDLDGGANAVAAHADRHRAGKYTHAAGAGGVDERQRRVPGVAAGRHQVHAIDLDAQPVVHHAVHAGQAGDAAGALHAKAGQSTQ